MNLIQTELSNVRQLARVSSVQERTRQGAATTRAFEQNQPAAQLVTTQPVTAAAQRRPRALKPSDDPAYRKEHRKDYPSEQPEHRKQQRKKKKEEKQRLLSESSEKK